MSNIFTEEATFCLRLEIAYLVIIIIVIFITICFIVITLIGLISHLCVAKRKLRHLELSIARLKHFDHHYSTDKVDNPDYGKIAQANRPRLSGNLKTLTTVTSDVSHNAEIITAKGDDEDYNNKLQNSLLNDPIKLHNQGATKFNNNVNSKLQVQTTNVILDQLNGLPTQIGEIQQSNNEMTLEQPSCAMTHYSLPNETIGNVTTPTNEQTVVDAFPGVFNDDPFNPINDLVADDISQSLQPVCDMQDCSNSVATTEVKQLKASRSMHLVGISIPYDDSGVPVVDKNTTITDEDVVTEYIPTNSDEAMELQSNPAYGTLDDNASEDHLYEEIF